MANNIKDEAPSYEYGSNRTTKDQIKNDAGVTLGLGLQMLQTTSVRVVNAKTYPSRLASSDPDAFKLGPQGEITMSNDLYPASNYFPSYPGTGDIEEGSVGNFTPVTMVGKGTPPNVVDPTNFYYLTSDTKIQDPRQALDAPAGVSTPATGVMGFFPVNRVPMGWITLGGSTRYIFKRVYSYTYTPTMMPLDPSDPIISAEPMNVIPRFANTEYTMLYNILKSWDLTYNETASQFEQSFQTKNPFSGYFVRTANPTYSGMAPNTHPFETEGQYMSSHSHNGYTYPNYASPINTYHASSRLPLVNDYLIDDLPGNKAPLTVSVDTTTNFDWGSVWKSPSYSNTSFFAANNNLGHDLSLYSYRKTNGTVLVYDSEDEDATPLNPNGKPVDMKPITWVDGRKNVLPTILNWNENIDLTIDIREQVVGVHQGATPNPNPTLRNFFPLAYYAPFGNYTNQYDYIALEYVHPTVFGQYDYFGKFKPIANEQIQYEIKFERKHNDARPGPSDFTIKFWNWEGTRLRIETNDSNIVNAFMGNSADNRYFDRTVPWNNSVKISDLNIYDIYRYAMLFGIQPLNNHKCYIPSKMKIWIRPNVNGNQFTNTHDLSLVYKSLGHATHDPELKHDYLKKVLPAGIYHIGNNTLNQMDTNRKTYANRKWLSNNKWQFSNLIHTLEVRSLDNSLNLDRGRTSYHVERVNRWNNADTDYYMRRGFYEPHANNLVYANSDFGVANTNQRIGTSYMFNYRYTFGSEWGEEGYTVTPPTTLPTWIHDSGSVFAQSTLKDVAPFTVIDHANIQHSVINYDTHIHTRIKTYHRSLVDRRLERKQTSPVLGWQRNPSGYVRTIGPEGLISGKAKESVSYPLLPPRKSRWVIKKDFSKTLADHLAFPDVAQGSTINTIVGKAADGANATGQDRPTGFPYQTWDNSRFDKLNQLPSFNDLWNANPDGTITANYSAEAEDGNPLELGGTNPSYDDPPNTPGISFTPQSQGGTKKYHVPNWRFRTLKASFETGQTDVYDNGSFFNSSAVTEYDYLGAATENDISAFLGIKDSTNPNAENRNVQLKKVWEHVGLPASYRYENSIAKPAHGYTSTQYRARGLKTYSNYARDRKHNDHHGWNRGRGRGAFTMDSTFGAGYNFNHDFHQYYNTWFAPMWRGGSHIDSYPSGYYGSSPHMHDDTNMYSTSGGRKSNIQGHGAHDADQVRRASSNLADGSANRDSSSNSDDHATHRDKGRDQYNWVMISGPQGQLSTYNTGDRAVHGTAIGRTTAGGSGALHPGVRVPDAYYNQVAADGSLQNQVNVSGGSKDKRHRRAGEHFERQRNVSYSTYGSVPGQNPWVFLNHETFTGNFLNHTTARDVWGTPSNISVSNQKVNSLSTFHQPSSSVLGDVQYRYLDRFNPEDQRSLYAFLSDYYSAYDIATEEYSVNNYTYKNPYFADARKQKQYRNYTAFRTRADRYLTVNTKHNLSGWKEDVVHVISYHNSQFGHKRFNWGERALWNRTTDRQLQAQALYARGKNCSVNVNTGKYRHYHPKDVMDFSLKQEISSKPEFYAPCHILRSDELTEDPYRLTFLNTGSSGPLAQRTSTVAGHEHDLIYANTTFRGDTEFRPINIALVPCIKI